MKMMFEISGLLITCLALPNIAYSTSSLKNVDSVNQWDCLTIPNDKLLELGSGLQSSDVPYYVANKNYTSIELFSSSGRHCSLHLDKAIAPLEVPLFKVYQPSSTVLYLREINVHQLIVKVEVSTCTIKELYKTVDGKRTEADWGPELSNFIQYDDGFDEVVQLNDAIYRVSYDLDGNQIGQPKAFHLDYVPSWVKTISSKSRSNNLVVDYYEQGPGVKTIKRFLSLVDADGRLVKQLLEFEFVGLNEFVDDVGDSSYAYCRRLSGSTECVRIDALGNEKYRNTMEGDSELLAVYNLKGDGVVLFTITDGRHGAQLNAIEMRSGGVHESSYNLPRDFNGIIFVNDFNEADRQFSVHTVSRVPVTSEQRVCRNTFSLSN